MIVDDGQEQQVDHGRRREEGPPWFDPPEDLPAEVEETARRIANLVVRRDAEEEISEGLSSVTGNRETESAALARAVSVLHRCLDAAAEDGADGVAADRRRLNRMAEALWQADVERERSRHREMVKEVSHDIRSPLNSILFLADGLYSGRSGPLTDAQERQLGVVYSAAASLLNMVNDLLDLARISEDEVGEPSRVAFSVNSVLADVRRLVGPIAEHRGCRLRTEIEVEEPRSGDPRIVSRVLVNLVSNAIDAAGEGGEVVVRMTGADGRLELQVLDDGEEVDPRKLEALTAPGGEAVLERSRTGESHGLGLLICGRLVRAAGGSISVGRSEEGWTRFTVELPFVRS